MNLHFEYANFALWFLLAMVYWKVTLQIILRWKWSVIPFVLLYLSHRFIISDLNYFDIGRAITFSLFFYLGHFAKDWTPFILQKVQTIPFRSVVFPLIGFGSMVAAIKMYEVGLITIERNWFYGTFDAFPRLLEKQTVFELLIDQTQTALFSLSMIMMFLLLVPTKTYHWTSIGSATLSIYLLHGFVRNYLIHNDYLFQVNTWTQASALAALSLVVVYMFSQKPFQVFVDALSSLLKRKQL